MAKWKVYNNHPHGLTHREKFKGDWIEIKAGDFIEMDYEDAVQFRGQYFPIMNNAMGVQDPASYKVIDIQPSELNATEEKVVEKHYCHLDGKVFPSKIALDKHMATNFPDIEPIRDEVIEAEITQQQMRKKPGPKPKEKTL